MTTTLPREIDRAHDEAEILAHIHGLFEAYRTGDRAAIERGHTRDWRGFQIPSRKIVSGIDEYMVVADRVLASFAMTRYSIDHVEYDFHGDFCVVFYIARDWLQDGAGERCVLLRSIDLYRKENGAWNQCGSHITALAEPENAMRTPTAKEREELLRAREAVWRAYFSGDRVALEQVLPEELIAINAGPGDWKDRPAIVADAEGFVAAGGKLLDLRFDRTDIQLYGDVALFYTTYTFTYELNGERGTTAGRGTELFVRRAGRWWNAGWHLDSGA
jgi:Domain of unknown function (DUF4440)